MDKELEAYYMARFDMMASRGWTDLLEDVEKMVEAYDNIERINGIEDLYYVKGQLDILNWIKNLKESSEQAFEDLTNA